jgi:hypothetical protein
MKFDEEPDYARLISIFNAILSPNPAIRPLLSEGAVKVGMARGSHISKF